MAKSRLSKCSRLELLSLLEAQMKENEALKQRVSQLEQELAQKNLVFEQSGSLAEAALKLSGIFEAADRAIQIFEDGVKKEWIHENPAPEQEA